MTKDCVNTAIEKYLERKDRNSNPTIVQMLNPRTKKKISHWYYRPD